MNVYVSTLVTPLPIENISATVTHTESIVISITPPLTVTHTCIGWTVSVLHISVSVVVTDGVTRIVSMTMFRVTGRDCRIYCRDKNQYRKNRTNQYQIIQSCLPTLLEIKFSTKNFASSSVLAILPILMQSRISLDMFQTESAINRAISSGISSKRALIS